VTRQLALLIALAVLASSVASAGPTRGKTPAPKKDPPAPKEPPPAPTPPPPPPPPEPPEEPPPKPGDKRRIIAILDVKVGEGVPPEIAAQFQKELNAQVDTKHYWLASHKRVHEALANSTKFTEGCVIGACLHEVRAQTGADVVLLAALTGSGTSFGSVITLVRTDNGRALAQESARCDVCTLNEAVSAATLAAVKLLSTIPETMPDELEVTRDAVEATRLPLEKKIAEVEEASHHRGTGLVLLIGGLVAAGAGIALYETQNHAPYGLGIAGAGGGLSLGGVVALTF
jgi:hypothetical protein